MCGRSLVVLVIALAACGDVTPEPTRFEEVGPDTATSASGGGGSAGGSATSTGGAGGGGGGAGTGGIPSCDEGPGEPNDTIDKAFELDPIDDCDDLSKLVVATLGDATDVDWYRFEGSDKAGCVVDPTLGFSANAALRLCVFFECHRGTAMIECPAGAVPDSANMLSGCCGSAPFAAGLDCGGSDDAATVYIRVDQAAAACEPYLITYHY